MCCKRIACKLQRKIVDDTNHVENAQANNEYVEAIDSHPDKLEDDDWVNSTHVEHITSKFN